MSGSAQEGPRPGDPGEPVAAEAPTPRRGSRRRAAVVETPPLGSLSQAHEVAPGSRECLHCGSPMLTRVPMTLADGTAVTFVSCQDCERRAWLSAEDGSEIGIDAVLGRTGRK